MYLWTMKSYTNSAMEIPKLKEMLMVFIFEVGAPCFELYCSEGTLYHELCNKFRGWQHLFHCGSICFLWLFFSFLLFSLVLVWLSCFSCSFALWFSLLAMLLQLLVFLMVCFLCFVSLFFLLFCFLEMLFVLLLFLKISK